MINIKSRFSPLTLLLLKAGGVYAAWLLIYDLVVLPDGSWYIGDVPKGKIFWVSVGIPNGTTSTWNGSFHINWENNLSVCDSEFGNSAITVIISVTLLINEVSNFICLEIIVTLNLSKSPAVAGFFVFPHLCLHSTMRKVWNEYIDHICPPKPKKFLWSS